jgi:nucleotide-binding universal stress UspA family protein
MKWIVGLDLRPSSQGALQFGSWLHEHARNENLIGVHIIEAEAGSSMSEELAAPAQTATKRAIEVAGAAGHFSELEIAAGETPEDNLANAVASHDADALLIGREGTASASPSDRLGRVARRLLQRLPVPVIVTRPDLQRGDVRGGPVLVCTDLQVPCEHALRFGRAMSTALGRELVIAHVTRRLSYPSIYLPGEDAKFAHAKVEERAQSALATWTQKHGADHVRTILDEGPVTRRILGVAQAEEACMIICGARPRNGGGFVSGAGAELAAIARIPVAVVPGQPD